MNLAGLSALLGGAQQGWAGAQQLRDQAVQLQQHQMDLDQRKATLRAQAAAFAGLSGLGGGGAGPGMGGPAPSPQPSPQPMFPGQPSVPSQPAVPPQGQPQSPQASLQLAPAPSQPGAGAPSPGQDQQQQQPQIDPMAGYKIALNIAKEIKSRNPGIDPQTLFQATEQVINLSRGLDPMLRQQAQVVVQQMKDSTSRANTTDKIVAGANQGDKNRASRESIAGGHDRTRLEAVTESGNNAMARTQYVQGQLNSRFQSGQATAAQKTAGEQRIKEINAQITAATRQLTALKNSATGQLDENDPRVKGAEAQIANANAKLEQMQKALKIPAQPAQAPAGGGKPDPLGLR